MQDLMDDARRYLSSQLNGFDMSSFTDEVIRQNVDSSYEGGWEQYVADYQRFFAMQEKGKTEAMTPIKRLARVQHMLRKRLGVHDEIIKADFSNTEVSIVVSFATYEAKARRDIITKRELVLYKFTRESKDQPWKRDMISVEEDVTDTVHRWGLINTLEREASQREQAETCYRPGTKRSPRRGWVARLEISHEQAHENEVFQRPPKSKEKTK